MEQELILQCPECGGEDFELPANLDVEKNGYAGVVCRGCDRPLTDDDVAAQANQVAKNALDDSLRDAWSAE